MEIKREDIISYINGLGQEELKEEMKVLIENFPVVNDYFSYHVNPEIDRDLLSKYEDLVESDLKNGDFQRCKDTIEIFKRICNNQESVVELKLYYAEMAIGTSNELSRVTSSVNSNILDAYEKVLQHIFEIGKQDYYNRRLRELVGFGTASFWSVSEGLQHLYNNYYNIDSDD